ncbi:MAG: L-glutamate gamma-semialdehyde dehydrogenase, partial [Burkholderiales bacterium]
MPSRLPHPYRNEHAVVTGLLAGLGEHIDWPAVAKQATPWVQGVREHPAPFWALESLLKEYPISSAEGLALMRLSEALLRVPDSETAVLLTADQLRGADFKDGSNSVLANLSSAAIALSKTLLPEAEQPSLLQRLGAQTVVAAAVRGIQLLGRQFVLGRDIDEALAQASTQRSRLARLRFSFDMLGEGARTEQDARRYFASYQSAIAAIAAQGARSAPEESDGISIKLSALFSRYEAAQHARVMAELLPRVLVLAEAAAGANINLTMDAEESDRLEISLDVLEAVASHCARKHPGWRGLGLAVQAYQIRALEVLSEVARLARKYNSRFMVRLVKGAYWDGEIKRAQELGLEGYPVFTHKHHTDVAYLACARALMLEKDVIYPQFATHNAGTIAAILQLSRTLGAPFEMQRLHGMGEGIYREVLKEEPQLSLRTYAPVGEHRDLLAYLVRRLLENGANSSFVHQLADDGLDSGALLASPLYAAAAPGQPLPRDLYVGRTNSFGMDLCCAEYREPLLDAVASVELPDVQQSSAEQAHATMHSLHSAWPRWNATSLETRAEMLNRAADELEKRFHHFAALLVAEGRKTLPDAISEVREAVDFCRYYAQEALRVLKPVALPGPTGESNELRLRGRGVFVCISPWNFPLAIFAGQVVAALVAGNTVAAKPAEQTPAVASAFVALLHDAGVPPDALIMLHGAGEVVGAALVRHEHCAGVCFTGSVQVAKHIQRTLAAKTGPIVPLIAETGGLNAMIVDSTALPEQVVDAVVQSAFRSAGQRCSALRLLCLHESVADAMITMLAGAMQQLVVGDPREWSTDVGPIIDGEAHANLRGHIERLQREARLVGSTPMAEVFSATHIVPVAFEIARVVDLKEEIFGPVLHIVRWRGAIDELIGELNELGYGLTLGIQTRIDSRAQHIAQRIRAGNVYVNRNMIGAVVGVQPFGGEGLSGTGPKAGGPHYLARFCAEQTL